MYIYVLYILQYQGYAILIYTLHCQLIEQFTEHGKMFYLELLYNVYIYTKSSTISES